VGGRDYREKVKEGEYSGNIALLYQYGKIRHVETIPGMGVGGDKGE
jgi:hypothetical protein